MDMSRPATQSAFDSEIDFSVRPETYWPETPTEQTVLAKIPGTVRRKAAEQAMAEPGDPRIAPVEFIFAERLDDEEREAWGQIHPAMMGGEYLPPPEEDEVEIARIDLQSVTADVIEVRARRASDGIHYRIVDEYDDESYQFVCRPGRTRQPLTMGALIGMIEGACENGIALSPIVGNIKCGADPDDMRDFVSVGSEFYPQLGRYYDYLIEQWFEVDHALTEKAKCPEQ